MTTHQKELVTKAYTFSALLSAGDATKASRQVSELLDKLAYALESECNYTNQLQGLIDDDAKTIKKLKKKLQHAKKGESNGL